MAALLGMPKPVMVMSPETVLWVLFALTLLLYEPDVLLFVILPIVWLPVITCWGACWDAVGDVGWTLLPNEPEVLLFVIWGIVWLPVICCWDAVGADGVVVATSAAVVTFLADLDLDDLKNLKAIVSQHLEIYRIKNKK